MGDAPLHANERHSSIRAGLDFEEGTYPFWERISLKHLD